MKQQRIRTIYMPAYMTKARRTLLRMVAVQHGFTAKREVTMAELVANAVEKAYGKEMDAIATELSKPPEAESEGVNV